MNRNFEKWLSEFDDSIASWKYYTDFEKAYNNVKTIKNELNLLNGLIGSKNIETDFRDLLLEYPNILKAIPILIAKRDDVVIIKDAIHDYHYSFKKMNYTIEEYVTFMRKTGIFDLLENHLVSNLYDYVTGVEVGMDTNARKNRTGDAMEDLVESVVENNNMLYVIETNFYGSQGSKLNETARSYKMLNQELEKINGIKFVWFTDGKGWKHAKGNLEETFNEMDDIYCIKEMKENIMEKVFSS